MFSADWWLLIGTPLETCSVEEARMVISMQDMKYQIPEAFYLDLEHLGRFKNACAILLFGNGAPEADYSHLDFSEFESLELLELSQNKLERLPDGVASCPSLRQLDLSDNASLQLDEEVAESWETPELEHLDVSGTGATSSCVDAMRRKYPQAEIVWYRQV